MPDAITIGKWIVLIGLGLAVLGGLVWLAGTPTVRWARQIMVPRE